MRKKVQDARDSAHREVKQVREAMAAMEEQHKAELKWGRDRRNRMAERLRAQNDEIAHLKQLLQKSLARKMIKK